MSRYVFLHGGVIYLPLRGHGLCLSDGCLNQAKYISTEELCKTSDGDQVSMVLLQDKPDPDLLSPVSNDSKFDDPDTYWAVKMVNLLGELAHLPPEAEVTEEQVNGTIGLIIDIIN